jgi:hypothetical protein
MSVLSGRTIGSGETALAAGFGWPGIWAELVLAPSSSLNVGVRVSVLYGSPVLGVGTGTGGELSGRFRLHVIAKDRMDIALTLEPAFAFGQGTVAGEEGPFADNFGYGASVRGGAVLGGQISEAVTLVLGLRLEGTFSDVPDAGRGDRLSAAGGVLIGAEALMSRDTLLFCEVLGGWGLAPTRLFDGHELLRVSLGLGYLF